MKRFHQWLALVLGAVLMLAACGGGTDDDPAGSAPSAQPDPGDDGTGSGGDPTNDGDTDDSGPSDSAARVVDPVYGGELSFLVEGETSTWDLPNAECATSCVNVFRLTADPLFIEDDEGTPQPFLLETYSVDETFRTWTLTLRDGISFQNGEVLDADALALDLERKTTGLTSGPVLGTVVSITSDGDRTVTLVFAEPHSSLASEMATPLGMVMAPAYWGDDHDRNAGGPIGTGPFVFDEWSPGERTVLVRNDAYWRTDADGRALPYLDRVIIRAVPSKTDREAIIRADDADLAHVDDVENPDLWLEDWDGGLITVDLNRETSYGLFNTDAAPFDDRDARRAVALCTDRETFNALINPGSTGANGPFAEGAIGHLDDTGFPAFDPDAGAALVDDLGGLAFDYLTTDDASERLAAELLVTMWQECGIDATFSQLSQSEVITRALVSDYEIVSWRLHGSVNPATEYIWWHSSNAEGIALNFGRIRDDRIDAALEALRATDDPAAQRAAAEDINLRFGEEVYNLWYAWSEWWIIHQADVQGIGDLDLPDGGVASPKTHGNVWLHQAWLAPG